jgi:prepilin-type N-terminal cleavage/methylation domain-containing protein
MNVQQKQKQKGFTIIEVVLVLAIAGLIFLMVFIALPALQRSQRDTQRKHDLAGAITQVNSYQSNNRGKAPQSQNEWKTLLDDYLHAGGDEFADPNGTAYLFTNAPVAQSAAGDGTIHWTKNAVCDGETLTLGQGNNKVAVQMKLEGGGTACNSN